MTEGRDDCGSSVAMEREMTTSDPSGGASSWSFMGGGGGFLVALDLVGDCAPTSSIDESGGNAGILVTG